MADEMTDADEDSRGMRALRAYEKERQEQFATGVNCIPLDITDLKRVQNGVAPKSHVH